MNMRHLPTIVQLHKQGKTIMEISADMGRSYTYIQKRLAYARTIGKLPPKIKQDNPRQRVKDAADRANLRLGHVSDVLTRLDKDTLQAVFAECNKEGFETLSEYLLEWVLEKHFGAVDSKSKAA